MKRAIIIRGQSGSGKSTTLRVIFRWLRLYYKPVISNYWSNGDIGCQMQIGSLSIGFCSAGDEGSQVQEFLNNCITGNCDIIIGACRAKGGTNQAVLKTLGMPAFVKSYISTYHVHKPLIKSFNKQCIREVRAHLIGLPK
jgi:ABC-type dipeptide/oligopeptide/nickel transport system ATPase component